jgi:hypothetical protein
MDLDPLALKSIGTIGSTTYKRLNCRNHFILEDIDAIQIGL